MKSSFAMAERLRLRIEGMTCGGCVSRVEQALRAVPGIQDVRVNLATGLATVELRETIQETAPLVNAVRGIGYDAEVVRGGDASSLGIERSHSVHIREQRQALIQAVGLAVPIMAVHWVGGLLQSRDHGGHVWPHAIQAILAGLLLLSSGGAPILIGGFQALRHRTPNMDLLIGMGVSVAFLAGVASLFGGHPDGEHFHALAMILGFINVGRYMEARARRDASEGVAALARRMPRSAQKVTSDGIKEVRIDQLRPGDRVRVAQDMVIPVDGRVSEGEAAVDESSLTGEPVPRHRGVGDAVASGSLVREGLITVEAEKVGHESVLGRIARIVEEAQSGKTRMQRLADRVAGVFVPIILAAAAVTFIGTFLRNDFTWGPAVQRAVAVLVIACPCALGLATPTAVLVATGAAAARGILVRDAVALEAAASVDTVLLDKTGTLTTGTPKVTDIFWVGEDREGNVKTSKRQNVEIGIRNPQSVRRPADNPQSLLGLAASVEQFSQHPLARAIIDYAKERNISLTEPSEFSDRPGMGVEAVVEGRRVLVGSAAFLRHHGIEPGGIYPLQADSTTDPTSAVWIAADQACVGAITFADQIRPHAAETISQLTELGLRTAMITGDQSAAAQAVARQLGIREIHAEQSPEGKVTLVDDYRKKGRRPAFVGDGLNDAAALAAADVGITFASASDVALGTAAVTIIHDRLDRLPDVFRLARRSVRIIKQNLFWAFVYNLAAVPLAVVGKISPGLAAAAMMFSSLSVVLNSLRLRKGAE